MIVGVLAGVSSGLFGIGGGVIIVPLLIFLLKYPQAVASATSLVALLLPVGVFGVLHFFRSGVIGSSEIQSGVWIASGMFLGTFFGARVASQLSNGTLTRMFAIFLVLLAARLWWMSQKS